MTDIKSLLSMLENDALPEDVTLVRVQIQEDVYGYHVSSIPYWVQNNEIPVDLQFPEEEITIDKHVIDGREIWAGFGPETKTLVIGKALN